MDVYVVQIEHKRDTDISLCLYEERALNIVDDFVQEQWETEMDDAPMPKDRAARIADYFAVMSGQNEEEYYSITKETIDEETQQGDPMPHLHHIENVARQRAQLPPEWEAYAWEYLEGGATRIEGSVPTIDAQGKKHWEKGTVYIVSDAEAETERQRYERETRHCGFCLGTGKELAEWSPERGAIYRPCTYCHGNPKAP
jgi:hypothetical protein